MKKLLKQIFMKKTNDLPYVDEKPEIEAMECEEVQESDDTPCEEKKPETEASECEEVSTSGDIASESEALYHSEDEAPADPLSQIDLSDPATVEALRKALNFDTELEAARAAGELAGRNARIQELMTIPDTTGDGLPFHGSGCAPAPLHAQSIFQLANQAR